MADWTLSWRTPDCVRAGVSAVMVAGGPRWKNRAANRRALAERRSYIRRHGSCPVVDEHAWNSFRSAVSDLLRQRGLPAEPTPNSGDALWCLGGPEVLREPAPDGDGGCIDLVVYTCERHRAVSVDIEGHHLSDWAAGLGEFDDGRGERLELGHSWDDASERLLRLLDEMFDAVLVAQPSR